MPNGTIHSGCTDLTQATTCYCLVIALVSMTQKSSTGPTVFSTGPTVFSNEKGHFGPNDRNDRTGQSAPPSKVVPSIPVRPNGWSIPFYFYPKFPEFWAEWKVPVSASCLEFEIRSSDQGPLSFWF